MRILDELKKPEEIKKFKNDVKGVDAVDTRDDSWRRNLGRYMSAHGFRLLGAGKYASVFGNDKYPFVVKVFMRDSAYQRWMKFSIDNKANPYVPVVKGKVIKISDMVFAVRLEKLKPVSSSWNNEPFMQEMRKWEKDSKYVSDDKHIQDVLDFFKANKKLIDIHGENVMSRPNGEFVVVDPLYNFYKPGKGYSIDPNEEIPGLF